VAAVAEHWRLSSSEPSFRWACTPLAESACLLPIYCLFTVCLLPVYCLFTACLVGVSRPSGTVWTRGTTAKARWQQSANHGGGYQYRLCPASEPLTEACFQKQPLAFANEKQMLRCANNCLSLPFDLICEPGRSEWSLSGAGILKTGRRNWQMAGSRAQTGGSFSRKGWLILSKNKQRHKR
jgi:hypothetical protein